MSYHRYWFPLTDDENYTIKEWIVDIGVCHFPYDETIERMLCMKRTRIKDEFYIYVKFKRISVV